MRIATASSRTSKKWKTEEWSWDRLLARLSADPVRTGETFAEYRAMTKDEQSNRKDVGGFVGGPITGGRRVRGSVPERWLITLDADDAEPGSWDDVTLLSQLAGYRLLAYTTHSHAPDAPRLRWVIPLSRAVTAEEYGAVSRMVASWIGIEQMDPLTYQPERLMYWPSCANDGEYLFWYQDGQTLDPDWVLHQYGVAADGTELWRDTAMWPTSEKEQQVVIRSAKHQTDPTTKRGIVGVFCRIWDIYTAIAEFLPDVYEPATAQETGEVLRYTYIPGSTSCGAVVYDGGLYLYSNHATDPAGGQLCNAFDLVRLHRFGHLDAGKEAQTDTTRLPSYQAMCEWAAALDEVKAQVVAERTAEVNDQFGDLGAPVSPTRPSEAGAEEKERHRNGERATTGSPNESDGGSDAWVRGLELKPKTSELEQTINNVRLVLENDPALQGMVGNNTFTYRIEFRRDPPWAKPGDSMVGRSWSDEDDAQLRLYLESKWGLNTRQKIDDAFAAVCAKCRFQPVQDYLSGLEWDGVERLDTLLVKYMGAEDSDYVRAVTRKWMVGAVQRVMRPGAQFDSMLVLIGAQGIGKSRLARVLAGEKWFSDSLPDIRGKDSMEAVRGKWIVEMAEMRQTRASDEQTLKAFLTKTVDTFRPAYGRHVQDFPRQCVFYGTSNDAEIFRDQTGGRRFWCVPVRGIGMGELPGLRRERDQIWAEAVVRWKAGEVLYLDDAALAREAAELTQMFTVEDEEQGRIEYYLDRLLPDTWEDLPKEDRRDFVQGRSMISTEGCTLRRDVISVPEVRNELYCEDDAGARGNNDLSRRIRMVLNTLPGWERVDGKRRRGVYGPQRVWVRKDSIDDLLA